MRGLITPEKHPLTAALKPVVPENIFSGTNAFPSVIPYEGINHLREASTDAGAEIGGTRKYSAGQMRFSASPLMRGLITLEKHPQMAALKPVIPENILSGTNAFPSVTPYERIKLLSAQHHQ